MTVRHVLKYTIPVAEHPTELVMPSGAKIVSVGSQQPGTVAMWAESEESHQPIGVREARMFVAVPTGVDFKDPDAVYVGTAHVRGLLPARADTYVIHIYEIPTETSTP